MAATSLVVTTAGSTFSVANTTPATYDQTGFSALSYTQIGEVLDAGTVGAMYTLVTHQAISNRAVIKRKGSYNNGALTLKLGRVASDLGQQAMVTAKNSDQSRSFKIVLQSGTTLFFSGQVMSFTTIMGNVDTILGAEAKVEIDNDILEF